MVAGLPRERHIASWLAALVVPSVICAITVAWLDRFMGIGGESALFFIGVLIVALLGGVAPAALSALLSGMLLNYFLTEPRYTWTIAEPDAAVTEFVLLAMAVAVAVLVDGAASRTREARRASQEAELLALFAGSVLRGADLATLLQRVRETYSQRAVTMLRVRQGASTGETVACVGTNPCRDVDSADTAIEVGDDEFWMLMAGRKLAARDRRVLTAVATQAAGLVKQRELAEEAGQAEAIARADELRRSLLSAVSHDLRTRWRRPRLRCPACAPKTSLSPRGYRRAVGHHRGVHRPTHRPGRKPARFVAVGCRRDSPQLRRAYLEEAVQRALVSIGKGATGFYRSGIDRVKVDVGDAVAMADAGLLERVLANLIDNALRYAPDCVVRVNAGRVRERVLINVIDEGPGVPRGTEEQLFAPFQRPGITTTPPVSVWGCRWHAASSRLWAARFRLPIPRAAGSQW